MPILSLLMTIRLNRLILIAVPDLSKGPEISPHTLPLGYIVEPTRYSGPYKKEDIQ